MAKLKEFILNTIVVISWLILYPIAFLGDLMVGLIQPCTQDGFAEQSPLHRVMSQMQLGDSIYVGYIYRERR